MNTMSVPIERILLQTPNEEHSRLFLSKVVRHRPGHDQLASVLRSLRQLNGRRQGRTTTRAPLSEGVGYDYWFEGGLPE